MAVILKPGVGFITGISRQWQFLPAPSGSIMGTSVSRVGTHLNILEYISQIEITACTTGVCGTPPMPDLVTSIEVIPEGCTVLSGGVPPIPEMSIGGGFSAPAVVYGKITGASVCLTLPFALTGGSHYTEKYLYDGGVGFSKVHKSGTTNPNETRFDMLEAARFYGSGQLYNYKRDKVIKVKRGPTGSDFPSSGTLGASTWMPKNVAAAGSKQNLLVDRIAAGKNYLIGYPPSLIRKLDFFYTIKVTHTCPPYITLFTAHCIVDNNWDNHAKRVKYRINRQKEPRESAT